MSEYPTHVQQAFNELHTGIRTGNEDLVVSGRKRLAAAGIDPKVPERAARAAVAGEQRQAAAVAAEVPVEVAKVTPPAGRTTQPRLHTTASQTTA